MKVKSKSGLLVYVFLIVAFLFTAFNFFYLKVVGIYGIAQIESRVPTSEGTDYNYSFKFDEVQYSGGFTGLGDYQIGDKYFVLFSAKSPEKNFLLYNKKVPACLRDSVNFY